MKMGRADTQHKATDGLHNIHITATDKADNQAQNTPTFTVDNTPPVINPEINPEAAKPGETINITVHASPDTQSVVAIIGTQRINLTFTNGTGIWITNYTIPLDSTFDIHTIRIEGTDTVGNIGKNTASYEVMDPNPIPPWLEELINPDKPTPTDMPIYTNNPEPGNNGGSNKPGSGTIGGNNQLYRDQMYIRNTLTYTPTTDPNTNTTTKPPEMSEWNIDTNLITDLLVPIQIAGGLALAFFAEGKKFSQPTQKIIDWFGQVKPFNAKTLGLFILEIALFFVDPGLMSYVSLVWGSLAFMSLISLVTQSAQTRFYDILSVIILLVTLAIIIKNISEHNSKGPVGKWLEDLVWDLIKRLRGK